MARTNFILSIPPGIFPDDGDFNSGARWTSGSNVRFVDGLPEVIGAWNDITSTPMSGTPRAIYQYKTGTGASRTIYGTTTRLYSELSATVDITPAGLPSGQGWSFANFGSTLLACQNKGRLYEWSGSGLATEVAGAPGGICILVTPERQVLAFGTEDEASGVFNAMCIRGSDLENYNDWTTTASNNAFEHILEGSLGGTIVTAQMVGGYVAVWTDHALYMGQFIGDPAQTYRFELVAANCGCLSLHGVAIAGNTAYWITNDYRLMRWTPGLVPEDLNGRVPAQFKAFMNTSKGTAQRSFAVYNAKFDEVWFFQPTGPLTTANPSRYAALSLRDGVWFTGGLERTAMHQGTTWLMATDANGRIYAHELGEFLGSMGEPTSPLSWSLSSGLIYFDSAERRVHLSEVWPADRYAANGYTLTITGFDKPNGNPVASVSIPMSAEKKNFRLNARLFKISIAGSDSGGMVDTRARLGKLTFPIIVGSGR